MEPLGFWILILLILAVYFIPWFIAHDRKHPEKGTIAFLNILLGWTGVVWVIIFLWAVLPPTEHIRELDHADHCRRKMEEAGKTAMGKLIPCGGCGMSISRFAEICPNCGHPQATDKSVEAKAQKAKEIAEAEERKKAEMAANQAQK